MSVALDALRHLQQEREAARMSTSHKPAGRQLSQDKIQWDLLRKDIAAGVGPMYPPRSAPLPGIAYPPPPPPPPGPVLRSPSPSTAPSPS
eukprot:23306-Chlamydomonas_euryale.AAC.2